MHRKKRRRVGNIIKRTYKEKIVPFLKDKLKRDIISSPKFKNIFAFYDNEQICIGTFFLESTLDFYPRRNSAIPKILLNFIT
jgi:hypothetical protein